MDKLSDFQKKRLGIWLITFASIEYFFALLDVATLLTFFLLFFPAILIIFLPKIKFIAEAKDAHVYESAFWLFITVPYFHYFFGILNNFVVFFLALGFSITSAPFGDAKKKLFGIITSIVIGLSIYIFTSFNYLSFIFLSFVLIWLLPYRVAKPKNKSSVKLKYWTISLREGWEFIYPYTRRWATWHSDENLRCWQLYILEKKNPNIIYRLDVEERLESSGYAWDIESQYYQKSSLVKNGKSGNWHDLEKKLDKEVDEYIKIHGDISTDAEDAIREKITRNLIWKK